MTIFDLGDLVTALLLLFLVLYFRARDSNNRSIQEMHRFLDNVRASLEDRFGGMLEDLEDRTTEMQAQRDLNIEYMRRGAQSYQNFIQSVEGLEAAQKQLEHLFESVQHYEEELHQVERQFDKVDRQTEQVHELDAHLKEQRRWAAELQNHLLQKLNEHQALLQGNFVQHLDEQKRGLTEELAKLTNRLQDLEENTASQAEALQRVNRTRSEWDTLERALQGDAERFRQNQQALRDRLQNVGQQNSQLENKVSSRQNQLQDAVEKLSSDYKELESELEKELERHRLDLRERLERDMQNLQHEQQSLLQKETEALMQKSIEQVHQRLQEFEQWCSSYFEKFSGIEVDIQKDRKALLEQFRGEMEQQVELMRENYREQAAELFGDWNILSENYHRLQLDFEHIESRSREELGAQFELYEKGFADDLRKRQTQLNEHLKQWDENLKKQLKELTQNLEHGQKENWTRNREVWERQVESERRDVKEQLRLARQQIQNHESEVEGEIHQLMADLKAEAKALQEAITQQNRDRDAEIRKRLEENGGELEEWAQKYQQMEKSMQNRSRKLEEQYETLDIRIQTDVRQMANNFETIEQQQQHILSNGKLIERAEHLWRDTREQISKLREQGSVLTTYAEQSQHLAKEFEYIRQLAQDTGEKLRALEASEERAEILQQNVGDLEQTLVQTSEKWEAMYAQNERVQQMEQYLQRIEDVYQERGKEFLALEEQAQNLEAHQAQVLQHIGDMQDIQSRIGTVERQIGPLEEKARELNRLQTVIEQNVGQTEELAGQLTLLRDLLDQAQERSNELQRMRGWLLNAEQRVKEMSESLDANIHLAEQLALQQGNAQSLSDSTVQDLNRIDEETRTMVFQLSEKGWDNATIAKQLNISVGAVELILEMSSMI